MIVGRIDANLEAKIAVKIIVSDRNHDIDFLVDTGFNGFIASPMTVVESLGLQLGEVQRGITADGRSGYFDTVRVTIIWNKEAIQLHAQVLDEPLIGTRLLRGYALDAAWLPGDAFTLTQLS